MRKKLNEAQKALIFFIFLCALVVVMIVIAIRAIDWSGPILSERNPNGTIDYWYLGDGANR